jgi:hypothetical protein
VIGRLQEVENLVVEEIVGWGAWDNYEREAHERWRALPWRERYSGRVIFKLALIAALIAALAWAKVAS